MATIKERKMTVTILGLVGIIVIAACLLMSVPLAGAENVTVKGRAVYHVAKVEAIEVGDVPGHVVGVMEMKGLFFHEDGEIGLFSNWIMFDLTNGIGTVLQGYALQTFEDGSTQVQKFQGTITVAEAGAFGIIGLLEGPFEWIKGTGRFEGIKGGGSYSGKRLVLPDVGGDSYFDFTGTYTLPE